MADSSSITEQHYVMQSAEALVLSGVSVRFGRTVALNHLTFTVRRGSLFGLLGANGSGKTTAIRLACGLLRPDSGDGHCLGESLHAKRPHRRSAIGYMAQATTLYDDLTVQENLEFRAALIGTTVSDLHYERHRLSRHHRTRLSMLSGGWRQRVAFASATLGAPQLVILDEPTSGLDVVARDAMWQAVRALTDQGITVIVSTHDAHEAAHCDELTILSEGQAQFVGSVASIPNGASGIEHLMRTSIAPSPAHTSTSS